MKKALKMNWKYVKNISNTQFRRLVRVKRSTYEIMVAELKTIWKLKQAEGGRPKKLSVEKPLLPALGYYREYASMAKTGSYFRYLAASECSEFNSFRIYEVVLVGLLGLELGLNIA